MTLDEPLVGTDRALFAVSVHRVAVFMDQLDRALQEPAPPTASKAPKFPPGSKQGP